MTAIVRRVQSHEWRQVRDLRLEALRDPAAPVAFLDTFANAAKLPDDFWHERTTGAATGDAVSQLVAIVGEEWVGSVSVIRRTVGDTDPHGRRVTVSRGDVVGVYLRPAQRGEGLIGALLDAAASWARSLGDGALALEVHVDNERAQAAYRRSGFTPTGLRFTGSIGAEFEMQRSLETVDRVPS